MEQYQPYIMLAIGILSVFGTGAILQLRMQRRWTKTDANDAEHAATAGKRIESNSNALQQVIARLEFVERRVDELQSKLSIEMANNSRLEAENAHCVKENERLAKRLHGFAEKLTHKDAEILELRNLVHALTLELQKLKSDIGHLPAHHPDDVVKVELVDSEVKLLPVDEKYKNGI